MDPLTLPSYLFGLSVASPALESLGAENLLRDAGKPGWLVVSLDLGSLTANLDFSTLAAAGFSLIIELNPPEGTFPAESRADLFAHECASVVESARGANLWLIGHETNRAHVPPAHYAATFAKCRLAIKSLPAHHDDWVMPAPPAVDDASGDWIKYFQDILFQCTQLDARPDALALHLSTRGHAASLIESDDKSETFPNRHLQFRAYRDFLGAVPPALRHLPVLITAAAPVEWHNENTGWINRACAEINAWNVVTNHQPIQALCIVPDWRPAWQDDFRLALQNDYRVRWHKLEPPPDYRVEWVAAPTLPHDKFVLDSTASVHAELKNTGARTWLAANAPPLPRVQLALRWLDSHGVEAKMPVLIPLPHNLPPGRTVRLDDIPVRPPNSVGTFTLRFDLQPDGGAWFSELGSPFHELTVQVVMPDYALEWVDVVEVPNNTLPANESVTGNARVKNTGALDWLRSGPYPTRLTYTWVDPQTAQVVERGDTFALVADTPTGRTALFENVTVRAPKTPGTCILRWDLIQEGITPYSAQGTRTLDATVEITAPVPDWAAKFTRPFQAGATVEPNETLAGDVAVDNVGTQTWTPDVVKLGYRWLTQDGQEISVGTDRDAQSFALASNVERDASTLFAHLAVRAPVRQGRYTLRFDLRHDDEWFSAGPSLPSDLQVEVRSAAPDYLARWDTVPQLPGILIADSTTTVQVGVTNIGAQLWFSHGANAVSLRGRWFDESYAPIVQQPDGCGVEQDVLPRDSYQFETVSLRVPHEPGEYTLIWDLYRAGAEGFGALGSPTPSQRLTVRPELRDYQAQFVAHDTPGNLPVNAEVSVNLRVRNIGAQVWRAFAMPLARQGADRRVALGYRWLDHEGNLVPSSKDWRSALSRDVKPDEEVVLRARLAAPPAPGTYELQWDLLVADDSFGTPLKCIMLITGAESPASYWRAEASLHAESAQRAVDGQVDTAWSSVAPQDTGMEFRVHFNTPRVMDALAFRSPGHGHPYGLKLEISAEGETWHTVLQVEKGNTTDVLATFMPQNVVAARLDLVAPSPTHSPWLVSEVAYHAGALWSVTASVNDELAARVLQIGAGAWSTNSAQKNETWFQLNLGRVELVSGLQLLPPRDENPRACIVLAWNEDTRAWQRVASVQDNTDPLDVTFAPLRTSHLIVQLTRDAERAWAIREVRVTKILTEWVR